MHATRATFKYPSLTDDGNFKKLQLEILCPVGLGRHTKNTMHNVTERSCTVEEVEHHYEALIVEAKKSYKPRHRSRKASTETAVGHLDQSAVSLDEETDVGEY